MLALFGDFYYRAYVKKRSPKNRQNNIKDKDDAYDDNNNSNGTIIVNSNNNNNSNHNNYNYNANNNKNSSSPIENNGTIKTMANGNGIICRNNANNNYYAKNATTANGI